MPGGVHARALPSCSRCQTEILRGPAGLAGEQHGTHKHHGLSKGKPPPKKQFSESGRVRVAGAQADPATLGLQAWEGTRCRNPESFNSGCRPRLCPEGALLRGDGWRNSTTWWNSTRFHWLPLPKPPAPPAGFGTQTADIQMTSEVNWSLPDITEPAKQTNKQTTFNSRQNLSMLTFCSFRFIYLKSKEREKE